MGRPRRSWVGLVEDEDDDPDDGTAGALVHAG
jgi:hypothetical protein